MYMNQSHKDPVIRELMQNIDFRAGISHAINRDEINQTIFLGLGGIQHPCAIPEDTYSVEGYGYTFTEFDIDLANQKLDAAGLTERDGGNMRLRPDGGELTLTVLTFDTNVDAYEMVKGYLETVGIRLAIEAVDATLWGERVRANDADIAGYTVAGLLWDIDPLWYVPVNQSTYWAPGFGTYFATGGESGEEPSELVLQLQDLYNQMVATADDAERISLGQQILGIHNDNVFMIGAVTMPFQPVVCNTSLGNVFRESVASYRAHNEGVTAYEQLYFKSA
jgi:peptide/nickel transport system substrate-binding protein